MSTHREPPREPASAPIEMKLRALLSTAAVMLVGAGCVEAPPPEARHVRNRFYLRQDAQSAQLEPPPHGGEGQSTAYRYFDDVVDQKIIFRKRALHKGASIGMHVLKHDEVYYIVSGRGELRVDDRRVEVGPQTAIFMHEGAEVGVWQQGDDDLVVIVSYPPADRP